jgi:hypothetical protein
MLSRVLHNKKGELTLPFFIMQYQNNQCSGLRTKLTTFTPGAALLFTPEEQLGELPPALFRACMCN